MRVAIITEGVSEYKNLPLIYPQIAAGAPHQIVSTLKINVSPDAEPRVVARECKSRLIIAAASGAQSAIIVLDRERQVSCPGQIASNLEAAVHSVCGSSLSVRVVLKDRSFENWLIADLDSLAAQPRRFNVTAALRRKVEPNKADSHDGLLLLKQLVAGKHYDKVSDSEKICKRVDVDKAAAHSRSFRHFLHLLEYSAYSRQCKRP